MAYRPFTPSGRNGAYVGPLGGFITDFALHLRSRGYSVWTAGYCLGVACEFSRWLKARDLRLSDLGHQTFARFLRSRSRRVPLRHDDRSALRRLIEFLWERRLIPAEGLHGSNLQIAGTRNTGHERVPATLRPIDLRGSSPAERAFEPYLADERGLVSTTRRNYLFYVRRFLSELKVADWSQVKRLAADDVTAYVVRHVGDHGRTTAKAMVTALRSFLRFLHIRGKTRTDLSKGVPTVPRYRMSSVPKFLCPEDVRLLLVACDRRTASGRRDYAILLTLARLGLRAGELAELTLEDVDWRAGEIVIRGKGGCESRLPLPRDVGRALADYLRRDRPRCKSRRLFIRNLGPWTGFANSQSVSNVVGRALERANLNPPHRGAHVLRHSLATQLLHKGASLLEIAEILRHRHPDTTAIYAKVDLQKLRRVARAWPGGAV